MKISTLLLVIVAAGIWLHIYMPAPGSKAAGEASRPQAGPVTLVGRIMEKTPEGLIVNCARDPAAEYAGGGAVNAFGRFLIKDYPNGNTMTGGEVVNVQGVDEGTCYSSGEFLQAYRYVGAGVGPWTGGGANAAGNSLDAASRRVGGWSRR